MPSEDEMILRAAFGALDEVELRCLVTYVDEGTHISNLAGNKTPP